MGISTSCATSTQKLLPFPDQRCRDWTGSACGYIWHSSKEQGGQELLQKRGGGRQGEAGLLVQDSTPPYFNWRASQSPAPCDLSHELRRVTADAGSQREGRFSAALFPSLEDLLLEEEVRDAEQQPEGGLSCLLF